jgi:hypothetical protein
MAPRWAFVALGFLILAFSPVYMVALLTAHGRAGIWVTWPTDRVYQEEGAKEPPRITTGHAVPAAKRGWTGIVTDHWAKPAILLRNAQQKKQLMS